MMQGAVVQTSLWIPHCIENRDFWSPTRIKVTGNLDPIIRHTLRLFWPIEDSQHRGGVWRLSEHPIALALTEI